MVFFLLGVVMMVTAAAATARVSFLFFHGLAMTAAATALGFLFALTDQGFNHFQHHIILCSSVDRPPTHGEAIGMILYTKA